ncbi:hypothetical protein EI94DRAFT_1716198 [Lactarius quietus]|nr:hypothetical protein EI94DRAFT_1716198 [Lactarius quietus]
MWEQQTSPNTPSGCRPRQSRPKTCKALPSKLRAPTPMSSSSTGPYGYRPSSTQSLLECLATYKLNTYANKPSAIDAVAAAKRGWVNDGKDRLVCGICKVS